MFNAKPTFMALCAALFAAPLPAAPAMAASTRTSLARVEARMGGRIGVFALRGNRAVGYRAGERFAYASTFKWVLGAAILKRVDAGTLRLDQPVAYGQADLLPYSPVTQARLQAQTGEGALPVGELCAATITVSDNTAANLLEPLVGGLEGMRAFTKSLGDSTMRFDRLEPDLNSNLPGDPRDTTTPRAMARLLRAAMESDALSPASRKQLLDWMKATRTGPDRIPAGAPGWPLAHKTGSGARGAIHDVAVLLPLGGEPIYLCVFTDGQARDTAAHEAAIAQATRIVLEVLDPGPPAAPH